MRRPLLVAAMVVIPVLAGFAGASPATAQPAPPCTFALAPPQVVQVGGESRVEAAVTPTGCGPLSSPAHSVVCLQRDDSAIQCAPARGPGVARVQVPHRPGAVYTAEGRGIGAWDGQPPGSNWQLLGPVTATL